MIDDPKQGKGIFDLSEEIKEKSILRHYSKEKPLTKILRHYSKEKPLTKTLSRKDFLFCEPSEVIIQSKSKPQII